MQFAYHHPNQWSSNGKWNFLLKRRRRKNSLTEKKKWTKALTAVSRQGTDINKLMTDRRNFDLLKAELNQLDSLCQQFHDAHNLYCDELATPEEKENASLS